MRGSARTYLIFAVVIIVLLVIFRPVPKVEESETLVHKGEVVQILESGNQDVLFRLKDGKAFYINRGLEQGLELDSLRHKFLQKELEFKYPDYWSLLHTETSPRHISKLSYKEEVVYSEFD
jgi:hypothetical protein